MHMYNTKAQREEDLWFSENVVLMYVYILAAMAVNFFMK